jgi:hypothetical protein
MDLALFQPSWPGLTVHTSSVTTQGKTTYALVATEQGQRLLAVQTPYNISLGNDFDLTFWTGGECSLWLGPLSRKNAAWLRSRLDWLRPTPQGLCTSVGMGDRLGLATPGHLRAVRSAVCSSGCTLAPIPAQQSIREMMRTGRTPQQVLDDAMWGVFSEGWRKGFGADADHLKTPEDIDRCLAAGYTFFTFDPGQFVDDTAMHGKAADLWESLEKLPWEQLEDCLEDLFARYLDKAFVCETHTIVFDKPTLIQAAVKYGRAVAQVATLYRHLASRADGQTWEVEVSVDETAFPTTHAEHIYLATELRRLGVHWVSLAPRFIGRFEKGVDYLGDPRAFEEDIAIHAAIARTLGPYKLSLHSGSDKFSIYEPAARQTHGLIHLKTAGTSYLEALRTVAAVDTDLMRSIYSFAREHYPADRASYHVSAELERAPSPDSFTAETATSLLNQFDAREILHVTFGSVLTAKMADGQWRFYDRIMDILRTYEEIYNEYLYIHFFQHLQPFAQLARGDM